MDTTASSPPTNDLCYQNSRRRGWLVLETAPRMQRAGSHNPLPILNSFFCSLAVKIIQRPELAAFRIWIIRKTNICLRIDERQRLGIINCFREPTRRRPRPKFGCRESPSSRPRSIARVPSRPCCCRFLIHRGRLCRERRRSSNR